jgi:hypothetical protein
MVAAKNLFFCVGAEEGGRECRREVSRLKR